jgi:hypothetical protein
VILLPGSRGAQAGIEPATAALVTQQIGSAGAGQIMSTQLHSKVSSLSCSNDSSPVGPSIMPLTREGDVEGDVRRAADRRNVLSESNRRPPGPPDLGAGRFRDPPYHQSRGSLGSARSPMTQHSALLGRDSAVSSSTGNAPR